MPEPGDQNGAEADFPLENRGDRFVVCTIVGEYYALPSRFISEVALFDRVYPLPLLPDYVLGIINRYSVPFALLDMGLLISGRPSFGAKALILKEPEAGERVNLEKTAFCIDDVIDIVEIALTDLLPLEKGDGVESSFSWKGRNVLVLDIRGIIDRVAGEIAA
ncbi:MAG: chemotaxis protein CheW [Treponema sp.]|jgi:purine-binding chemotaxis protein CheW|nr:chemotaxis protein CheW [Treponema sp.]